MTIKEDIKSMFWEPAVDYASSIIPFDESPDENEQQLLWDKIHRAYTKGVEDVLEYVFNNYNIYGSANQTKELNKEYCQCEFPDRDSGYVYCQRCNKNVSPARMRFLVGKDEMFDLPSDESDPEELKRKRLRDRGEYHSLCARATLYPGKSIEEVKRIQQNKRIEEAYNFVNDILCNEKNKMNTPETRQWVIKLLQGRLDAVVVRCNEELNSPDVIDQNLLVAEAMWNSDYSNEYQIKKVLLVFGEIQQVEKYQRQHYFDNETYKFIQKV